MSQQKSDWASIVVTIATTAVAMIGDFVWLVWLAPLVAIRPLWHLAKRINEHYPFEVFIFAFVPLCWGIYISDTLIGQKEKYSFTIRTVINSWVSDGRTSGLMIAHKTGDNDTLSPVHLILLIDITNNQTVQSKIRSYYFDWSSNRDGPWQRLKPIL